MSDARKCAHIDALFKDHQQKTTILSKHSAIARWSVHRLQSSTPSAKRRKLAPPTCGECSTPMSRPFACLHCDFVGCWKGAHIGEHLKDEDHALCSDARTGSVFCVECNDFVYNRQMDEERASAILGAEELETRFQTSKKPRDQHKLWTPNPSEQMVLDVSSMVPCQGRRGLLNLGQTCFLNSILQALVHTPLVRSYFLSDRHNRILCKHKDCMCCEMDEIFSEVFSGTSAPYAPTSFLATMWRSAAELAGYQQQDAHECFISLRHGLHTTARGSTQSACNCVMHEAFGGMLQSSVTCGKCGNTTSTMDPVQDFSLEIQASPDEKKEKDKKERTLADCLGWFIRDEKLASKDYTCAKCKGPNEATKALSIRKLPPVMVFHLKRFEHKDEKSAARKVTEQVRFPTTLNMLPYTTIGINARKVGPAKAAPFGPRGMYDYDLFAVVCHEGAIDNGHNYTYARYHDEWWKYDDDKVTKATLHQVLNSPAYMLFYCKKHLDYRPHVTPTYVLSREHEARREEEREREKEAARVKELDDELMEML